MLIRFIVCLAISLLICVVTLGTSARAATLTRLETFDSDALDQFDEIGGTHTAGNDFGFSATSNVGLGAGEAGGLMARSHTIRAYADLDLGGTLHRNENLHLSGSFTLTNVTANCTFFIGFFNTADLDAGNIGETVDGLPFLGMMIFEPAGSPSFDVGGEFRAIPGVWNSVDVLPPYPYEHPNLPIFLTQNSTHTFNLDWTANSDGSGTLAGTIAGRSVSVTATASLDSYNAFGIGTGLTVETGYPLPDSEQQGLMFVDNLTYSIIPEPASAVLLALGLVALVFLATNPTRQGGKSSHRGLGAHREV